MNDDQKARQAINDATDDDGLTFLSCASGMSQDDVRAGDWWFRLDRVPWQLADHASRRPALWPKTRVRINLSEPGVHELDWGKLDRQELRDLTVYADPNKPAHAWGPQMCRFWWNYPDARTAAFQVEEFAIGRGANPVPVSRYMPSAGSRTPCTRRCSASTPTHARGLARLRRSVLRDEPARSGVPER